MSRGRASSALVRALLLALAITPGAAHGAPRSSGAVLAAVVIPEAADQPAAAQRSLRELLAEELEKRGIKVNRQPIPARLAAQKRGLAAYASARRLKRVYELRLQPAATGRKIVVSLAERRGPRLRASFSARLAAASLQEVDALIPNLVEAVVEHKEPRAPTPRRVAAAAPPTAAQVHAAPGASAPPAPGPDDAPTRGEFLWGVSFEPGSFLRAAQGLYGGSVQLYYQRAPYRAGLSIGGMGGAGHLVSFNLRGQVVFLPTWKVSPLVGAALGYLLLRDQSGADGSGAYGSASLGAQLNTVVHWARFVVEAEFVLPMFQSVAFDAQQTSGMYDLVKRSGWTPVAFVKLGCLF